MQAFVTECKVQGGSVFFVIIFFSWRLKKVTYFEKQLLNIFIYLFVFRSIFSLHKLEQLNKHGAVV